LNGALPRFSESPIGGDESLDHGRDQLGRISDGLSCRPPKDFGIGGEVAMDGGR